MANPAWRNIGGRQVPERPGVAWTALVENVTPGKIIKIEVARTGQPAPAEAAKVAAAKAEAKLKADVAAQTARQQAIALNVANQALATAEASQTAADIDRRAAELVTAANASTAAEANAAAAKAALKAVDSVPTDQTWTPKSRRTMHRGRERDRAGRG